jgi:hypothetical protein
LRCPLHEHIAAMVLQPATGFPGTGHSGAPPVAVMIASQARRASPETR